jgi:hypothetical protein
VNDPVDSTFCGVKKRTLGQLLSLQWLDLAMNRALTGTIPTELGQLVSLDGLGMSNYQLTGTIPSELAKIANLTEAYFHENALTGSLEQSLCIDNRTMYSPFRTIRSSGSGGITIIIIMVMIMAIDKNMVTVNGILQSSHQRPPRGRFI